MDKISELNIDKRLAELRKSKERLTAVYGRVKGETERFVAKLREAVTCDEQNRHADYIKNNNNFKNDFENRRSEIIKLAFELDSLDKWSEFIENAVSNVKRCKAAINSYETSPEEKEKQQGYLSYYCVFLNALVYYLVGEKDPSSGNRRFIAVIRGNNDKLCGEIESELKESKESADEYLRTRKLRRREEAIGTLTETPEIPKEFPEEARLCIGTYSSGFDIANGNSAFVDGESVFPETKEVLKDLLSQLKDYETRYKKLIYMLSSAGRESNVFALDFARAGENNHIAVHQQRYSETEDKDSAVIEMLQSAICRYMGLFPKTAKRIAAIQSRDLSRLEPFVQNITVENKYKELVFTADDRSDSAVCGNAENLLKPLLSECASISKMLGGCVNLFDYDRRNYKNGVWKQMTLLIIKDYPLGFNEQAVKMLKSILGQANKLGVYVIMTVCDDLLEEAKARYQSIDFGGVLNFFANDFDLCVNEKGEYVGSMISRLSYEKVNFGDYSLKSETFRREKYFTEFEKKMLAADDPYIPLQSLLEGGLKNAAIEDDNRRKNFFKVLTFPIGKEGTKTYSIDLYQSGGGSPHMVIAGTTGSGKSVLLHDIIMSAMCCYTPEELELYLFDFKETAEGFDIYEKGFPHIKKIAMECKDRDITELLKMIKGAYVSRMKTVKDFIDGHPDANVTNTIEYNAYARGHGMRQIPRMLVIIDEYQTITSDANLALILEIAQKGREYGVVLIMASQSNNVTSFNNIIRLFGHRVEFKNEPIGALISRAGSRAQELFGPKGLCFYSHDGSSGIPVLIRCSFVNKKKDLPQFKEYMAKKYAQYPVNTYKIGSVDEIMRIAEFNDEEGFISLEQIARSGGKVYDGETEGYNNWLKKAEAKIGGGGNLQNAGYILNLGLKSMSLAPFEYTLERKNPYLVAFGDSFRIESLFYSAAKSVIEVTAKTDNTKNTPIVYYFNGNKSLRRESPFNSLVDRSDAIEFCDREICAKKTIDSLYEEFLKRKAEPNSFAAPIVILISEFISFIDLFGLEKEEKKSVTLKREGVTAAAQQDLEAKHANSGVSWLQLANQLQGEMPQGENVQPAERKPQEMKPQTENKQDDEVSTAYKFNTLLSAEGGRYGFFFCLQISDSSKNNYIKKHMETTKLSSVIYLDGRRYDYEEEENGGLDQISAFNAVFLPNRRAKISINDVKSSYSYWFTTESTVEFIPYEYKLK